MEEKIRKLKYTKPKSYYPSVLVFTPIYEAKEYCLQKFIDHCKNITYPNYEHIFIDNSKDDLKFYNKLKDKYKVKAFHVDRGGSSREALARAQNFARRYAITHGFNYIFSLESDIFIPYETIETLMTWGKPVVTGVYLIGNEKIKVPCITLPKLSESIGAWGTRLLEPDEYIEYINKGLKQVQAGGFGCCLIRKDIYENYKFGYDPRFSGHSDIYFFNELFKKRVPVFVDTSVFCDHKMSDWTKVKDR